MKHPLPRFKPKIGGTIVMYRQEKYLQKPEGGAVHIVELSALFFFNQGCNVKG